MTRLVTKNLSFSPSPTKEILRDLSFAFETGEIVFLMGANGSGKSTLLRLLSGVLLPNRGVIEWNGIPLQTLSPKQRACEIGALFQSKAPSIDFTVREICIFGRTPRLPRLAAPTENDNQAVDGALEALHLTDLAGRPANNLSSGEFQRLQIAALLALESPVMLLDEPTSVQDPAWSREILEILKTLSWQKATLVVSHDLELARKYATRVLLLKDGSLLADGTPQNALTTSTLDEVYRI